MNDADLRHSMWSTFLNSPRLRALLWPRRVPEVEEIDGMLATMVDGTSVGFGRNYAYHCGIVLPGFNRCTACRQVFLEHANDAGSCRYHRGPFAHLVDTADCSRGPGRIPELRSCGACGVRIDLLEGAPFDLPLPYHAKGCASKAHVAELPPTDFTRPESFDGRKAAGFSPPPPDSRDGIDVFTDEPPATPPWPTPTEMLSGA